MPHEEIGRRALVLGAGCAVLAALGACDVISGRKPTAPSPQVKRVLAAITEVPVGGGILNPEGVLVLQLKVGEFTAFSATCPHQFYLVRPPDSDGIMTCTGHQSKFRAVDGVRVDGPATSNLTAIKVTVSEGNVVRV